MKSRVCPCTLFVVIAKHGLTGNCLLFRVKGNSVSDGAKVILGINTHFPLLTPLAISTSRTLSPSFKITNHVPFLNPFPGPALRFYSKITGAPAFRVIEWGGIPDGVTKFKKSIGYVLFKSPSAIESPDRCVLPSPGNFFMTISFILSTFSFFGVSIA